MGTVVGCGVRDRSLFNRETPKEENTRQPEPSPRDVRFRGASPRSWQWKEGVLKISQRAATAASNYSPLNIEEEEEDKPQRLQSNISEAQMAWVDEWLGSVESGELDIYTCLALSNCFTWTADTRKLLAKVFAVTILQVGIPSIMLYLEIIGEGLTYKPAVEGKGFRAIGSALYLYSVYSMYNGALDECRARLLNFAFSYQLPAGYWAPLVLGELSNVFVATVLVITLYVIYTDLEVPADLILNAVAVNFLGSVDAEFVNEELKKDAIANFKGLTDDVLSCQDEAEEDADEGTKDTLIDRCLRIFLYGVACMGIMLAIVFFFAPTQSNKHLEEEAACRKHMNRR